ncbi:hypothetical protein l11_08040 [Neisseria weaveri LMG 5135]|nr:hypothetical protein l13_20310 [Neisseria weaveri ATCC 51223]EGV38066.1 hypothetical protein l11_08040 [Neisseria weaveri LMG 5135]
MPFNNFFIFNQIATLLQNHEIAQQTNDTFFNAEQQYKKPNP